MNRSEGSAQSSTTTDTAGAQGGWSLARATTIVVAFALVATSCTYTAIALAPTIPPNAEASTIMAADGAELLTLHAGENRTEISLEIVPVHVQNAIVAIEDRRFWTHIGIDLRSILRALRRNIDEGDIVEGGSTITQQFVKNAIIGTDRTLDRKIEEASLAIQVERQYTKEEILEFYLNTVYFGAGAYGIEAAAQVYFGVTASDLTVGQGALLAGLVKAPSTFDPFVNPQGALDRRSLVLQAMVDEDYLTNSEASAWNNGDLVLKAPDPEDHYEGAYFVEEVKRFMLEHVAFGRTYEERARLLFTGGLTIETTLDPALQTGAEAAVNLVLSDPQADPNSAVVTIDPATGYVLAMVGGRDFFGGAPASKFNLATQAARPSGSSFKPLVLAAAIEEGISTSQEYSAPANIEIPITNDIWEVENYGGSAGETVNLVEATVRSYNTAYAQLMMDVGPADAVAVARDLGVSAPLQAIPSAVLGANDVSPLDMTVAYATFANRGVRNDPVYVTRVTGPDGEVIYQYDPSPLRAIDRSTADEVTAVLQQVISRGTGVRARIGRPVAGKTGTGQNWGDAWFVGYTPDLVTGVWVGYAEGQIPMVPPQTRIRVTGGTWPAEIWQLYMTAALAEVPIVDFTFAELDAEPDSETGSESAASAGATAGPTTTIPGELVRDVVGMQSELASEILTRAGFVVVENSVPDDQYPPGIVASQTPTGESIVETGAEIVINVANGQKVRRVPDVLGESAEVATARLRAAGYEVDLIDEVESDPRAAELRQGQVWKVDPGTGAALVPGETVAIWINPT
ncbi:MAG: PBP1A family penicillin-binding protein [Actinobacteria bacterium]|nr:PBP1A family penicillin-binding protein [Actinomycetota bacterium]